MKPLAAAVSLLLVFGCASPAEKGDETALRTQEADRGAYALPQQANPGDYPDLRPTTERPKPRPSRGTPRVSRDPRPPLPAGGALLARIRWCESRNNYTAYNPRSGASGAYQYLKSTWAGYKGYSEARFAPPAIQDERAAFDLARLGPRPWYASRRCWGG